MFFGSDVPLSLYFPLVGFNTRSRETEALCTTLPEELEVFDEDLFRSYYHGRRAGEEEKTEIRVVSGETNLIPHIVIDQLYLQKTVVL